MKNHNKQKPLDLCDYDPDLEEILSKEDLNSFIKEKLRQNEQSLHSKGYSFRAAKAEDLPSIMDLIKTRCSPFVIDQLKESDLYRCIVFGHCMLIENQNDKLVSFKASVGYVNAEKSSFGVFSVVSASDTGKGLHVHSKNYTSLKAMQDGQLTMKTWASTTNYASIKNSLNYGGFFCDGYHPDLYLPDTPRITLTQYLTPSGIYNNCISDNRLKRYLSDPANIGSYRLINCTDHRGLIKCFEEEKEVIIAFVSQKITSIENAFLAIPSSHLKTVDL